jgi:anti-sigma factor RsiW
MPRRLSSSCRQFRGQHVDFVDGFLDTEMMREREAHLTQCAACQRYDTQIRRSLLVLQALPQITPSPDFGRRLAERLAQESMRPVPTARHQVRWGIAAVMLAASVTLLIVAPRSAPPPTPSLPSTAFAQVPALLASRPATPAPVVTPAPDVTHRTTKPVEPRRSARFEAVPGQAPLRTAPALARPSAMRLQTVSAIGQ